MGRFETLDLCSVLLFVSVILNSFVLFSHGGITSGYDRKLEATVDMPLDSDVFRVPPGYNAPQQVHITQGDLEGKAVMVSWVTQEAPGSNTVLYWRENSSQKLQAHGKSKTYKFYNYTSGHIHHCPIRNLEYDTKYYYVVGVGQTEREFWFYTPPQIGPDVPYTFGLIGHLCQSFDSNITLTHYENNPAKGQTVLFLGDLSCADQYPNHDNNRWDSWGRFVERNTAYQPWIWTTGNHELDFSPKIGETEPFRPFTHRYRTPYGASGSTEPFWYSVKRGPAHIIVLASYSAYGTYSPQFIWMDEEFSKVNRTETPWLIVLMHSPWYNIYGVHIYEPWFVKNKVDVVFSVHPYEGPVVNGIFSPVQDQSTPVYITIGDGGILEGLATKMTEPQPNYSAFREASFGHAIFSIRNRTHAYYEWHMNHDGYAVKGETMWLYNRFWHPVDDSHSSDS